MVEASHPWLHPEYCPLKYGQPVRKHPHVFCPGQDWPTSRHKVDLGGGQEPACAERRLSGGVQMQRRSSRFLDEGWPAPKLDLGQLEAQGELGGAVAWIHWSTPTNMDGLAIHRCVWRTGGGGGYGALSSKGCILR